MSVYNGVPKASVNSYFRIVVLSVLSDGHLYLSGARGLANRMTMGRLVCDEAPYRIQRMLNPFEPIRNRARVVHNSIWLLKRLCQTYAGGQQPCGRGFFKDGFDAPADR
jgi:hypothetical protein